MTADTSFVPSQSPISTPSPMNALEDGFEVAAAVETPTETTPPVPTEMSASAVAPRISLVIPRPFVFTIRTSLPGQAPPAGASRSAEPGRHTGCTQISRC